MEMSLPKVMFYDDYKRCMMIHEEDEEDVVY